MDKWRFFSDREVEGLSSDLVYKLDRAREYFGAPIIITSGYRNPDHNKDIGGVQDSAHTKGLAVDIRVPQDQEMRDKLFWALGRAGFERVGAYDRHAHMDTDKDKPTPAFWWGVSK